VGTRARSRERQRAWGDKDQDQGESIEEFARGKEEKIKA
jgi:hypothetical protein